MKFSYTLVYSSVLTLLLTACGTTNTANIDSNNTTIDKIPEFTSITEKSIPENTKDILTITTSQTQDINFTITGGDDRDKFIIDPQNRMLLFKTAPDFENPTDANKDNRYIVTITATNNNGATATQTITVLVTNDKKDDGPSFVSSDTVSIRENQELDFTITAEDNNSVNLTYIISGGSDQKRFILNNSTGKLSFNLFTPDFDYPSDSDKNNRYDIIVKAINDHNISNEQNLSILITDDADDLVPTRLVFKTGQDDGLVQGLPFGEDRDFKIVETNNQRAISFGNRMWEDSEHVINTTLDFGSANNYCDTLSYAGYDDWRAPNRHELAEIINYGKKDVLFDDFFEYKKGGRFWTSQERLSNTGDHSKAWSISFTDGEEYDELKGSNFNIRCVRGERIEDHNDFTVKGDTVIDNKTGIVWQNAEFIGYRNWQEAIDYCKNLVFEGYSDWRLPNVNELRTIMPVDDNEILFKHLSPIGNGNLDSGHSWSTTEYNETHARYNLNFWDEESNRDSLIVMYAEWTKEQNNDMMLNRCIRGGHL